MPYKKRYQAFQVSKDLIYAGAMRVGACQIRRPLAAGSSDPRPVVTLDGLGAGRKTASMLGNVQDQVDDCGSGNRMGRIGYQGRAPKAQVLLIHGGQHLDLTPSTRLDLDLAVEHLIAKFGEDQVFAFGQHRGREGRTL